jgi:hypothetical protein
MVITKVLEWMLYFRASAVLNVINELAVRLEYAVNLPSPSRHAGRTWLRRRGCSYSFAQDGRLFESECPIRAVALKRGAQVEYCAGDTPGCVNYDSIYSTR